MRIDYEGSPARASAFASMLRDEGLTVEYEPPDEYRDVLTDVAHVVFMILDSADKIVTVAATLEMARRAKRKFHQRWPRGARIEIEGDDEPEQ